MSVSNGQDVAATVFNTAFVSKIINNILAGKITLNNSEAGSGAQIVNLQAAVNNLLSAIGMLGEADPDAKNYSSTNYIANGDSRKACVEKLDIKLAEVAGSVAGFYVKETQSISASGTISVDVDKPLQIIPIQGNGAAVELSLTPFGTEGGWKNGAMVVLVGMNDTNHVTIKTSDDAKGFIGNGKYALTKYSILKLVYLSGLDRWIEISRTI